MKFGKTIQSQQVPGWGEYYLNYKALKKIINSYAAGRPASDASLLNLGIRPAKRTLSTGSAISTNDNGSPSSQPSPVPLSSQAITPQERTESFKAHRDVFFFTLQRELEKINAFYLIKERDLRLRLLSLLTNRNRLLQSGSRGTVNGDDDASGMSVDPDLTNTTTTSAGNNEWGSLEEGWRLFERDLGKLQGFIEINATGFRKILKKWDKRSKSNTKALYIERQVEVQPCFNREFITKLSDVVAANLLDLETGSDNLPRAIFADLPGSLGADGLALDHDMDFDLHPGRAMATEALMTFESNLVRALHAGPEAIAEGLKAGRERQLKGDHDKRLMRILWRAALQVPDDCLTMVLNTVQLDFDYVDDINGRDPLHQACIFGSLQIVKLCLAKSPHLLEQIDTYGRRPLHYAAMHGRAAVVSYLLDHSAEPTATDMDGYTPLMHAITNGHLDVVQIFVDRKISLEPTKISNDLIPLSLACQYGQFEVARLLLRCGAKILPNSEGMYPQHFAAKAGHQAICQLLVDEGGPDGGGKDRKEKYNLWTPMHHAAVGVGPEHLACVMILVEAGCDVNDPDEYGKTPGWYAAWYGHVECLNFLIDHGARLGDRQPNSASSDTLGWSADPQMEGMSPGSDVDMQQAQGDDVDAIPSLSLPPPIIPLRVYGHEFLAQRSLVQLSLGHPFSQPSSSRPPPVKLYSRTGQDPLHTWSSLKLVMTSKSDISAIPHSVILPLADQREVFTFQVQSLERFTLELSLYPTFGSKVIGRAVILPSTFLDIRYHKGFQAPLLDHQLKTIGEVAFEVSCIKPFEDAQLEIGGRVETYWKSKVTPTATTQDHAHLTQSHLPLSVSTSSPALRPPIGLVPTAKPTASSESALVTASSLSGEYVEIIVQVTKDAVPVVYPEWRLPLEGIDVGVPEISYDQFQRLASSSGRTMSSLSTTNGFSSGVTGWRDQISKGMMSLEELLSHIPSEIGLNIQLRYAREIRVSKLIGGRSIEVNDFVDCVLRRIYDAGKVNPGRKIILSSFDPTVCTALNWKQPNFAVFFASYCGISSDLPASSSSDLVPASPEEESDMRCLSVREAVNFAKTNNLLGLILEATTMAAVPSLVASVKDVGLLLATFGDEGHVSKLRSENGEGRTLDAFVQDGIMTLTV